MTKDEIKKVLREYLPAKYALASATAELVSTRKTADGLRAVVISDLPHGSGGKSDPVGAAVCKLQAAEKRLAAAAERYRAKLEQIEQLISLADDAYGQSIIRLRWIEGLGFDFIPARINLQRSSMFEHYERAISQISAKTESPD